MELYKKLISDLHELNTNTEFSILVKVLNGIDDEGFKFRYSKDKKQQEKPAFIKADRKLKLKR